MADRYWVGGTGTWNTGTTNWSATSGGSSGASAPTSADNVIFDQATTYTVTLTSSLNCLDITVSAGTVTFSGNTSSISIYGSMSLVAETVWSNTGTLFFNATTTGKTITTNGISMKCTVIFNGIGGGWSLGSTVIFDNTTNSYGITLTNGALDLNGYDLTCGEFKSNNSNVRSIAFGSNYIIICGLYSTNYGLTMNTITNFSCTGSGGFYVIELSALTARYYSCGSTAGGSSANAPNLTFSTGTGSNTQIFTTGSWFNILDFGTSGYTVTAGGATSLNLNGLTLSSNGTYTSLTVNMRGTGTITSNGKTIAPFTVNNGVGTVTLADALSCTTYTQTAGTIDFATFNLTCSGSAAYTSGTLSNIGTITCTSLNITGTFTLTQGIITPSTSFVLTSGAFIYNGGTLTTPLFTHTSGTVTLGTNLSPGVTSTYTLTAGTLDLAGFTLTTGIFSSSNANTRSIAFGTGSIALSHTTAATTVLSMATATGFTYTGTGGFTVAAMSNTRTFSFGTTGGTSANAPNLTFTTGASIATLTTGGYFNKLDFGTTSFNPGVTYLSVNSITLSSSGTYTTLALDLRGSGTLTFNGKTTEAIYLLSGTPIFADTITCTTFYVNGPAFNFTSGTLNPTTRFTLTSGSFTYNGGTLGAAAFTHTAGTVTFNASYALTATATYILTAGTLILADGVTLSTGAFSSSNSNTRSIYFGNASAGNINLTHTTAATTVLSMATATGFTYTGPGGFTVADMSVARTFSFGSTAGGTTSNAPRLTFTTGASVATLTTASWFNTLNFGTTSFNPGTTSLNVNALTLSSSGTYTSLSATMVGTGTITTNTKTITALTVNATASSVNQTGTATLAGALTMSGVFTLTQGTLNCGVYNVQSATFSSTGTLNRTVSGSGTYTITGSGATAFSNASAAGISFVGIIISMDSASAKTFAGGGGSYSRLRQYGAGDLTLSGSNFFDEIMDGVQPTTMKFTAGTTTIVNKFNYNGSSPGNATSGCTIASSSAGNTFILSKSFGIVSVSWNLIKDSIATGGAVWYASNSVNQGNNTGWIFSDPITYSNITISDCSIDTTTGGITISGSPIT